MADTNDKKSKISEVKEALYSRKTDGIFTPKRHPLHDKNNPSKVEEGWNVKEEKAESQIQVPYSKILLGAFIFFVLASTFAFYKFFVGSNTVSGDNINILVSGPASVSGGEVLPLDIEVKNNDITDLKVVDLRIEFPDGTKNPDDTSVDMKRYTEILGDINVGQSAKRLVKAVLFGEENSEKVIKITVEYRIAGSNAIFDKEKDYNIVISSSPINIVVTGPSEINANQQTNFSVSLKSNSLSTLKNLILKVDYPFGFSLVSTNPKPYSSDGTVFNLGDLEPGAERLIRITGNIVGQDGEEKVLKFTVGTPDKNDDKAIGTAFSTKTLTLSIVRSSVGLNMLINQDENNEVPIDVGRKIRASITWQNNLPEKIYDMSVNIKFTGLTLDKSSVNVENGFYNSSANSITFDKNNIPLLGAVSPSDQGNMNFDFATLIPSMSGGVSFTNAQIIMDITVTGNRGGSVNAGEVLYSGRKVLKISSSAKLLSRSFKTVGPFQNSGPFPPRVDQESTYTITWTVTDSFNNLNSVRVSSQLPPNVKWTDFTSPSAENISYDGNSGQVVWNIGSMKSGIGDSYPAKEASFQVSITPSVTQVGSEVNLLNESTISAIDSFSGARIGEVKPGVSTKVTSDPEYMEDIGKVVQ
jgi:hypothetical protein